jgi:diacylglycerol kinase (ATP)
MTKRAMLCINRHARQGEQNLESAIRELEALGFDLLILPDESENELYEFIRQHYHEVELIIIGGGDGTLNSFVDVLMEVKLPVGILPLGTANDLARTLDLPLTLPEACQVIAKGESHCIDVGWVNGKHFFNVASFGLSVKITEQLSQSAKQRWGVLAYAIATLQASWQARPFRAQITCHGETFSVKSLQIAVGNGSYYGGGLRVASEAAIDDQQLNLYSLEIKHWWQTIPLLLTLSQGTHGSLEFVRTLDSEELKIHTRRKHPINTDGEITTTTPATFKVIPEALCVFVSSQIVSKT